MKDYFIITYSQVRLTDNKELSCTTVVSKTPAEFLMALTVEYPDSNNKIWYSAKITKCQFEFLDGRVG